MLKLRLISIGIKILNAASVDTYNVSKTKIIFNKINHKRVKLFKLGTSAGILRYK